MSPNKLIMKIYSITNLIVFILYHECSYFLYKFNQISDCLTLENLRIIFVLFMDGGSSSFFPTIGVS